MTQEEFNKELEDAHIVIGNSGMTNNRLLSKEARIFALNKSLNDLIKSNAEYYYKPENFDEIIDELMSMKNVYVARTPCDYHFTESGEYVGEFPTTTHRSLDPRGIFDSVKYFLEKGATVYLYTYHMMKQGVASGFLEDKSVDYKMSDTYWWRIIAKR